MEVQGRIKLKKETQTFGSNGFQKRELVVTTDEKYPQDIMIEFIQDKCSLLDSYNEGDEVMISINLRGREWTSPQGEIKYFNTVQGWKIASVGIPAGAPNQAPPAFNEAPAAAPVAFEEEDDDLPF